MKFSEMSLEQLSESRREHIARKASGAGTDTYRALLDAAVRGIDDEMTARLKEKDHE